MSSLNLLLLLLLLIWFWRENLQAREAATRICRDICASHGAQFLDQTVALHRFGIRWRDGIRLRRIYEFDYSLEGSGRKTGYIMMLGKQLEPISIELGIHN